MNPYEIEGMLRNIELMKGEIQFLWNEIFALPEEERPPLRARYQRVYLAYREYRRFVQERTGA